MKIKTASGAQRLSIRLINLSLDADYDRFIKIYFNILPTNCKSKNFNSKVPISESGRADHAGLVLKQAPPDFFI